MLSPSICHHVLTCRNCSDSFCAERSLLIRITETNDDDPDYLTSILYNAEFSEKSFDAVLVSSKSVGFAALQIVSTRLENHLTGVMSNFSQSSRTSILICNVFVQVESNPARASCLQKPSDQSSFHYWPAQFLQLRSIGQLTHNWTVSSASEGRNY